MKNGVKARVKRAAGESAQHGPEIGLRPGLLGHITRRIVRRFKPRRIVLFGSRARGDARPDSDVDLFVEMESRLDPFSRAAQIQGVFGLRPWSMDLVVYTPQEVKKERGMAGFLMDEIDREGRTLYAKENGKH